MKIPLVLIIVFKFAVFSAFGQNADIQKAGKILEKALEKSSKVIADVAINGCHAEIRIVTAEMDFRPTQWAPPVQGMAGFPTGDYGMNNLSGDTGRIYRSKKYAIDFSQVVPGSFSASEFSHRDRKFASVAFASKPGSMSLKSGKSSEIVGKFRIGVRPEKLANVESAFQAMFGACVPTK